jgi:hypothetical protein
MEVEMKRRSFLRSAAAVLPAVGLDVFALAQATSVPTPGEVHVVGAGQDRLGEPHSLGFSTILFKVLPRETGDGLFVIAGKMEGFFREAAVPNGPKMDAPLFAKYDMQYVGPPLVAG